MHPSSLGTPGAWAVLAALPRDADAVVVTDGATTVVAVDPEQVLTARSGAAFDALDAIDESGGWWAGWLSYDLGHAVEPVVPRARDDHGLPDIAMARFGARLVLDPRRGTATLVGSGRGRDLLEHAAEAAIGASPAFSALPIADLAPATVWECSLGRADFEAGVRAIVELIRAGDCYQVNLTRRLVSPTAIDAVELFRQLAFHNPAPHAAFVRLEQAGATVVSASPERFLRRDGLRVETCPIKGTDRDAGRLTTSVKDRAENVMIVDLARNDLGRVAEFGSVTVPRLCAVEAHPGLHHLVSTVAARLRSGTTTSALLRATLAPASVTGAPKPRVMQIIEDVEPIRRGVYCGAVGWIDASRSALDLNVAIRTFTVTSRHTTLGVGGGIVADSDPEREWDETELKAARLLEAADAAALAGVAR